MIPVKDFILQILIPLREAWGYIYGYAGTMWTAQLQDRIEKTTDENRAASRQYGSQWIGRMVTDCSGLIRWAILKLGGEIPHHARYQYTNHCSKKGTLVNGKRDDGKPVLPGTAVFLQRPQDKIHHVGVYVGNGICVEAKGARYGVVTSPLDYWDHWGELKAIDYSGAAELEGAIEIPERGEGREPETAGPKAVVSNPRSWLNLRAKPDSGSAMVAQMPKGSVVDVLTQEPKWWQVRYGGRTGWAFAEYLSLIEPDQEEPGDEDQEIDLSGTETEPEPADGETDTSVALSELRGIRERIDQVIRIMGG